MLFVNAVLNVAPFCEENLILRFKISIYPVNVFALDVMRMNDEFES
jgi:hypothetical protein